MPLLLRNLPLFALIPLTAAPLSAQLVGGQGETLWRFDGQAAGYQLGYSVSDAGDVDGDGFDDVIVGARNAAPGGLFGAGSAYVYSGATGALVWQFDGQGWYNYLGQSVSGAGDVDGDGFDDVIVGAPLADPGGLYRAGSAYVYSGATGALVWQFDGQASLDHLGLSVSGAGDVDGDGFDDVTVGAPFADPGGLDSAGSAYVYSGATGGLIWRFDGQAPGDMLGSSVSGAGDVDGDGLDDVIGGAPGVSNGAIDNAGSAYVCSGATGALLWRFDGKAALEGLGGSVSGAGDVDGDGFDDVIVGADGASPGGLYDAGSAYVYSGATGALVWQFNGEAGYRLGWPVSGAGDVDGDGLDDVIVGAIEADPGGRRGAGSAYVYSGATGALVWQFDGQAAHVCLGWSVSGAGDVDGDGFDDVIVAAVEATAGAVFHAGSAWVWSIDPLLHLDSGQLSATSGIPLQLDLDFPPTEAGFPYAVLASTRGTGPATLGGIQIPLALWGPLTQKLLSGWNPPVLLNGSGILDANGDAQATILSDPVLMPFIGTTVYLAAVSWDPGTMTGRLSSIARYLTIVP